MLIDKWRAGRILSGATNCVSYDHYLIGTGNKLRNNRSISYARWSSQFSVCFKFKRTLWVTKFKRFNPLNFYFEYTLGPLFYEATEQIIKYLTENLYISLCGAYKRLFIRYWIRVHWKMIYMTWFMLYKFKN